MAAAILPHTTELPHTADRSAGREPAHRPPALRLIDGGRSRAQLARRRTFRRRRVLALVLLAAVVGLLWLAALGVRSLVAAPGAPAAPTDPSTSAATAAVPPAAAEEYVVRAGDTLWVIAERVAPGADPRPVVDELSDRAGGPVLQAGQRIDLGGLER